MELFERLQAELEVRKAQGNYRELPLISYRQDNILFDSSTYIDLASNDYLCVARDGIFVKEFFETFNDSEASGSKFAQQILANFINPGSTGSRLLTGNQLAYSYCEDLLASLFSRSQSCPWSPDNAVYRHTHQTGFSEEQTRNAQQSYAYRAEYLGKTQANVAELNSSMQAEQKVKTTSYEAKLSAPYSKLESSAYVTCGKDIKASLAKTKSEAPKDISITQSSLAAKDTVEAASQLPTQLGFELYAQAQAAKAVDKHSSLDKCSSTDKGMSSDKHSTLSKGSSVEKNSSLEKNNSSDKNTNTDKHSSLDKCSHTEAGTCATLAKNLASSPAVLSATKLEQSTDSLSLNKHNSGLLKMTEHKSPLSKLSALAAQTKQSDSLQAKNSELLSQEEQICSRSVAEVASLTTKQNKAIKNKSLYKQDSRKLYGVAASALKVDKQAMARDCLYLNSGFDANCGILSTLFKEGDLLLVDKLAHASLIDGMLQSKAKAIRFAHNDMDHLAHLLQTHAAQYANVVVVTEAVFSMDGDRAKLKQIVEFKKKYPNLLIYVDEAHSFGLLGENGLGLCQELQVLDKVDFIMGTLSKAIGSQGAFLICPRVVKHYLINYMRNFIYATALPPVNVAFSMYIVGLLDTRAMQYRRNYLQKICNYLHLNLLEMDLMPSESQIQPLITGDNNKAAYMSEVFKRAGLLALPIRHPTVPLNKVRLRMSLNCNLRIDDVDLICSLIKRYRTMFCSNISKV